MAAHQMMPEDAFDAAMAQYEADIAALKAAIAANPPNKNQLLVQLRDLMVRQANMVQRQRVATEAANANLQAALNILEHRQQ